LPDRERTPVHDEIWSSVPADRPLDRDVVDFALDACAREAGRAAGPIRVLDLGCGDGRVAAELARAGARVSGTDPSPVALERARAAYPDLDFRAPLEDGRLPLSDSSFELVVCLQVLQHVADTQLLLSEARRVLVPGGQLTVAVPWHGRLKNALIALRSFERHHDPLEPVLRFYTSRSLAGLLEQLGFEQVELAARGGLPLAREALLARARRGSP
jgi:ubiquinone/menaquinone biosynthesis C-methylase UbiE